MDFRLDKHLHVSNLKQKQQLWSQTAKNALQLAILVMLLVFGIFYYAQVSVPILNISNLFSLSHSNLQDHT